MDKLLAQLDKSKYQVPDNWPHKEAHAFFADPEVNPVDVSAPSHYTSRLCVSYLATPAHHTSSARTHTYCIAHTCTHEEAHAIFADSEVDPRGCECGLIHPHPQQHARTHKDTSYTHTRVCTYAHAHTPSHTR